MNDTYSFTDYLTQLKNLNSQDLQDLYLALKDEADLRGIRLAQRSGPADWFNSHIVLERFGLGGKISWHDKSKSDV